MHIYLNNTSINDKILEHFYLQSCRATVLQLELRIQRTTKLIYKLSLGYNNHFSVLKINFLDAVFNVQKKSFAHLCM